MSRGTTELIHVSTWKPGTQEVLCKCLLRLWSRKCVHARNISVRFQPQGCRAGPRWVSLPPAVKPSHSCFLVALIPCPEPVALIPQLGSHARILAARSLESSPEFSQWEAGLRPPETHNWGNFSKCGKGTVWAPTDGALLAPYADEQNEAQGGEGAWPAREGPTVWFFPTPSSPINTQGLCATQNPLLPRGRDAGGGPQCRP